MRRLFWTFPDGLPGAGLLLMRLVTSGAVLYSILRDWQGLAFNTQSAVRFAELASALLLIVGLATPFCGAGVAAIELWRAHADPGEALTHALLAAFGTSLVLLGAGAASADAWIFGWRRIDVAETRRRRDRHTP